MLTKINEFQDYLKGKEDFNLVKNNYYLYVPENFNISDDGHLFYRIKIAKIVIIDHYIQPNEEYSSYFIISFMNVVLTIKESSLKCLQKLFSSKKDMFICYLSDSKDIFCHYVTTEYKEIKNDRTFQEEISNFIERYTKSPETNNEINEILKVIGPSLFGSFIKEAYLKYDYKRFQNYSGSNKPTLHHLNKDDFITLRTLGVGSSFRVDLVYQVNLRELFALKKLNIMKDENQKLIEREIDNYLNLYYQLLPRFYGVIIDDNNYKSIVIEFINGRTLLDIKKLNLNEDEKLFIIFELLMTLNYAHNKNYVLRDLKPNNIMIDSHKNAVIIDLDRAIKVRNDEVNVERNVSGIGSNFCAPEIESDNLLSGDTANKCDIYSLGKIMFWIYEMRIQRNGDFIRNPTIQAIYDICTIDDPLKRPSISKLYMSFYGLFQDKIDKLCIDNLQYTSIINDINDISKMFIKQFGRSPYDVLKRHGYKPDPQFFLDNFCKYLYELKINPSNAYYQLALIDYQGRFGSQNIEKAIFNFQIAATYNNSDALYLLGVIYKNKKNDIEKALFYFQQASNLDNKLAHYSIGLIYYEGKHVKKDIRRAHYYFCLAERKNCIEALVNLGFIYLNGGEIKRNIPKAIEYFTRAANQNDEKALIALGYIFYEDVYVLHDINKSIHYFSEAAKRDNSRALLCLGIIYFNGKYINRDINKAIDYFKRSAYLNDPYAQLNLGNLFYDGIYVEKNIDQAINYYMLAADSKNIDALIRLSLIYLEGRYRDYDIQKVIYYLQQASIDYGNVSNKYSLSFAQYMLSNFYLRGTIIEQNINKGLFYLIKASENDFDEATFKLAYFFHEGKLINRDIQKAIELYKKLSSFNNQYAKNNLGIIYKNGFDEVDQNNRWAILYFNEAIKQKKDCLSMYNLAHIYFYNEKCQNMIDLIIHLLIESSNLG